MWFCVTFPYGIPAAVILHNVLSPQQFSHTGANSDNVAVGFRDRDPAEIQARRTARRLSGSLVPASSLGPS
jgi:hypothetical protein